MFHPENPVNSDDIHNTRITLEQYALELEDLKALLQQSQCDHLILVCLSEQFKRLDVDPIAIQQLNAHIKTWTNNLKTTHKTPRYNEILNRISTIESSIESLSKRYENDFCRLSVEIMKSANFKDASELWYNDSNCGNKSDNVHNRRGGGGGLG